MAHAPGYRERLLPRWWAWLVAAGVVAMPAVAYGAALGAAAGWLVAAGLGLIAIVLMWITAPGVAVDAQGLRVGRARLPAWAIGSVETVDSEAIARLRGPGSDARLFVVLRPWSAPGGIVVQVADPDDPHPAWLITSRHPARAAAAVADTMASTREPEGRRPDSRQEEDA